MGTGVMTDTPVILEVRSGVAIVTMNRPERRNAISREMLDGLGGAVRRAVADDTVHAIIVTGAGD
jgi:enoyl-CoA hydratase/carnithine racemase